MRYYYSRVAAFVIDAQGRPAAPIKVSKYAKYLVKNGHAQIIVRHPLTIRMTHNTHTKKRKNNKEAIYGEVL